MSAQILRYRFVQFHVLPLAPEQIGPRNIGDYTIIRTGISQDPLDVLLEFHPQLLETNVVDHQKSGETYCYFLQVQDLDGSWTSVKALSLTRDLRCSVCKDADGGCSNCALIPAFRVEDDESNDTEEPVTPDEILRRAIEVMGDTPEAHEAARHFPGDFM